MKIEFIIPAYKKPHHLMAIISSIFAQTSDQWFIHVIFDGPQDGINDKVVDYYKDSDKIKFTTLPERTNDWGHTPRNYGLAEAKEEWVVMSGDDNYYTPKFVELMLQEVKEDIHFVYCNMLHNWVNFEYYYIVSAPVKGKIDIGNFMSRTNLAKQLKINVKDQLGDGTFVEEYLQKFPTGKTKHITRALYVHN
jgi:glycosyltransferase involved in cell wall biosynthesis